MIPYHDYEGAEYEYPEEEPMTEEQVAKVFEVATEDLRQKRKATNKDWLNSMSAETFADWLTDTFDLCGAGCSNCFVKELCFDEHNNKLPNDLIVEWLKQPHTFK